METTELKEMTCYVIDNWLIVIPIPDESYNHST